MSTYALWDSFPFIIHKHKTKKQQKSMDGKVNQQMPVLIRFFEIVCLAQCIMIRLNSSFMFVTVAQYDKMGSFVACSLISSSSSKYDKTISNN